MFEVLMLLVGIAGIQHKKQAAYNWHAIAE